MNHNEHFRIAILDNAFFDQLFLKCRLVRAILSPDRFEVMEKRARGPESVLPAERYKQRAFCLLWRPDDTAPSILLVFAARYASGVTAS